MPFAPQELRTFFITAVTANRRRLFQAESNAKLLLNLFTEGRAKNRYQLHAFVIMPDHIHLLTTPAQMSPSKKPCNSSRAEPKTSNTLQPQECFHSIPFQRI
jgi:REP element-mobilizing transposase RayT